MNLEREWLNLIGAIGLAKPKALDENSLNDWARPDKVSLPRRNRPLLLEVLLAAKNGTLDLYSTEEVHFGGGTIQLQDLPPFQRLLTHQLPNSNRRMEVTTLLEWVKGWIGQEAVDELTKASTADLQNLAGELATYFEIEETMYSKSKAYQEKYEVENQKLLRVRKVVEKPIFGDSNQRVAYLEEYRMKALGPLVETIKANEEIRELYFNHYINHVGDFVMRRVGIQIKALQLPSFENIYAIMDQMPSFDDQEAFEAWKSGTALQQVEENWNDAIERINREFEAAIDISKSEKVVAVENGKVNIQINNCYGGTQKAVLFNPETHASS